MKTVIGLLLARDKDSLIELANQKGWEILPKTGYSFDKFESDDDLSLPFVDDMDGVAVDGVAVDGPGFAALAFRKE